MRPASTGKRRSARRWCALWAVLIMVLASACASGQPGAGGPDLPPISEAPEEPSPSASPMSAGTDGVLDFQFDCMDCDGRWQADLNRNGVPETIQTYDIYDGQRKRVEISENGKLLWSDEADNAHAGWNAVFLCTMDGEDCLLRYNPYMAQGMAGYGYQFFTLSETGEEQVVQANSVRFDINFSPVLHESFDPEAIAALTDEVNGLLANSVQLINTDLNLLDTFEREGRLYDSLWWLDNWEPVFTRDEGKSLLENLRGFQKAMEAE